MYANHGRRTAVAITLNLWGENTVVGIVGSMRRQSSIACAEAWLVTSRSVKHVVIAVSVTARQ